MFSCQTFPFFSTFLCFFMFVCFLLLSCLLLLCGVIEARSVIIILKSHGLNDHTYYTQITTNFTFPPLHRRSWMVQRVVFQTHITCTCVCESFFSRSSSHSLKHGHRRGQAKDLRLCGVSAVVQLLMCIYFLTYLFDICNLHLKRWEACLCARALVLLLRCHHHHHLG